MDTIMLFLPEHSPFHSSHWYKTWILQRYSLFWLGIFIECIYRDVYPSNKYVSAIEIFS